MITTADHDFLPKPLLLVIALAQGLFLWILHLSMESQFWPGQSYPWLFAFYAVGVIGPLMLLLSLERAGTARPVLLWVLPFTLLAGLLGYYAGRQVVPELSPGSGNVAFVFGFTMAIATFKALMYAQQRATGEPFQYSHLFRFSWRNFLTLGLAGLFTLAVWGILMLWAALFRVININLFHDLFTSEWFYYPVLALANGFGIIIFRNQSKVIDTITRIQQALMKFLLVFLVLVSILFLAALPFTGLAPLWETGSGSTLILWMQAGMLFFLNAVYQDDPEARPYPLVLHRFIYLGIALLPVYSAIAFYGLWLRVEQYGWTPSRCWGILIWALFALFSLGYLWGILRRRDHWLRHLSWVNVRMGLLVLATLLLVNSPLLDFRKISVASQLERLDSGEVALEDFDFHFFRYRLARPGYDALQELKAAAAESNPKIAQEIEDLFTRDRWETGLPDKTEFIDSLEVFASGPLPGPLQEAIYEFASNNRWRFFGPAESAILQVDMDGNSQDDYVLMIDRGRARELVLFYSTLEGWLHSSMARTESISQRGDGADLSELLRERRWRTVEPRWKVLEINGIRYQVGGM